VLTAAEQESPPSEATVRKLGTFARYGARIDKDMATALQALRARSDAWLDERQDDTCEPNQPSPRTSEPDGQPLAELQPPGPVLAPASMDMSTREPEPRLNRHQRRAMAAMRRSRAA
jgi:hypothetical protein